MASRGRERSGKADLPTVTILVNGTPITVDQRTLTMRERQQVRAEMGKLAKQGIEPDELDNLAGVIWIVMRRDDQSLTYEQVCESFDMGDLLDAETATADEVDEAAPEG